MDIQVKSRSGLHTYRKSLLAISLIIVLLVSTLLFVYVFIMNSGDASLTNVLHVKNEDELRNAINSIPNRWSVFIALDSDIVLTSEIKIPVHKNITLTSNHDVEFFKLIGAADMSVLVVETGGVLRLDGIIVTHTSGTGRGVSVNSGGTLTMHNGEISGNTAYPNDGGGGVYNQGTFEMYGGRISDNIGKGVFTMGIFKMFGGEISGNYAMYGGGGVYNTGTFTMCGGIISNNTATDGGGVYNPTNSIFTMLGGKITENTAINRGGGVANWGRFNKSDGEISGNTADVDSDVHK